MTMNVGAIRASDLLDALQKKFPQPTPLSDEARIANLRSAFEIWHKSCPFKPGDLVKPAKHSGSFKAEAGICIVLRILSEPVERCLAADQPIMSYDMRILAVHDAGQVTEYEAPSRDFELVAGAEA